MAVRGRDKLHRRLLRFEQTAVKELRAAMERIAKMLVAEMKAAAPLPEIAAAIKWKWGGAEDGQMVIATSSAGRKYATLRVTIYVEKGKNAPVDAWYAHLFEYGTVERHRKKVGGKFKGAEKTGTGKIAAQPFMFPTYRARRADIQRRLSYALRKAVRKVNNG